jgi:REP-associated tyrosine transposase
MPRRKRDGTAGLTFHVLNRAAKRAVLFENSGDYAAFERLLHEAVARFRIALFAYCIMPNHWHFVLTPTLDGALSRFMHWLETTHARRWQNARGLAGLGAVYQGRFKAIPIANDGHFLWVCRYVERNPLRASLVERAEEWPWSSLKCHGRQKPSLLAEWPVSRPADWVSQVNVPQTDAELQAFRRAMQDETPFGEDDWRREVQEILEMSPRRRRGRPRKQPLRSVLFK